MEILEKKIQLLLNLFKTRQLVKAKLLNKQLIDKYPKNAFLHNIQGLILIDQKEINKAIECYEYAIKINENFAPLYDNLATAYKLKGIYNKAESYYKKSILLDNKLPEPQNNLGSLYALLNKNQEAVVCYKKALNINPNFFMTHYNLGVTYKNIGLFDEARKHFKNAIKINKFFYSAHRSLSELINYAENDEHYKILEEIYKRNNNKENDKAELGFALGKATSDLKNYKVSFKYYTEANKLRRKQINFSIKKEKVIFSGIKKVFSRKLFSKFNNSGNQNSTPIFILGMPRSGTTLVEQILSSHPRVYGGGELNFLPTLIKKNIDDGEKGLFLKNIMNIDNQNLIMFAKDYINQLNNLSNNSEKVTDKLPVNFKWIGFIKLILPNSKIVHCVRNSKDNCLSIFRNYFSNPELNFAYDLKEIISFYNFYYDLMKHWKETLPKVIIDIKYEDLVNNPREQIYELLKRCNLEWDANCLKFYNNKRPIKTASDTQVRKKIYKGSINSWKNYEKHLKLIFRKLPD